MSDDFVYGYHPVRELLRHRPQTVIEVLVAGRRAGRRRAEVEELCRRHRLRLTTVDEGELRALAGAGSHNGFGARLRPGAAGSPSQGTVGDSGLLVLVEDVQDPRNLGALLRVCEGVGVGRVLVRDRGSAPLTASVARTSAGATEWLDLERITNSAREIERLKDDGYWIYGAAGGGDPPWECDLTGKVLICMGGEEKGLRALTRKHCDRLVGLPMQGRVESLNLATAASALLYEAFRQRTVASGAEDM